MPTEAGAAPVETVAVIGGSSLVGDCLLPLLTQSGARTVAYSRSMHAASGQGIEWRRLQNPTSPAPGEEPVQKPASIRHWICVAPIWVLPEHFAFLEAHGVRRIVALSSSSRFTKAESSIPEEQVLSRRLAEAETHVQNWAEGRGVEWVTLRPTMIYGRGQDKNISEIARFIRRFGFFPLLGKALGARQPIHAEDVAAACLAALDSPIAANRAYNISGGETLPYREMVIRIFTAQHLRPRLVTIPLVMFGLAVTCMRLLPRYRHWSAGMAERMNCDLVFDHADASRDLGFSPRPFVLAAGDLPR